VNLVGLGMTVAVAAGVLTAVAAAAVPDRVRGFVTGAGTVATGTAGLVAGVAAMGGTRWAAELPWLLPLFGVRLAVDALSGVFLAVVGAVAVAVAVYGVGHAEHAGAARSAQAALPVFVTAMLLVPAAAGIGTLLACWELMALASLVLVLAEHRRRPEVASAGRWYAVMTHLGLLLVLGGLMLFAAAADGAVDGAMVDSFAELRAARPSPVVAGVVFVAVLAGFGSKAGMVPLHAWLPRAHPEAPSHVSALMSAAMVSLGVYGLVRVGLDLLGGGARWWWLLVLTAGAVSAVYGVLQAAMSTDLKQLLGCSTTENMGLVLVAVGAAGLFATGGRPGLAALAMAAGLLHVVTHAAFKTLLFLGAGSVLAATGTRDLDRLGGLRTVLPHTTAAFGLGALAASALPPGAAFVSEWLLLQALVHGLPAPDAATAVAVPVAVAAVALTAGLGVATFVKAFGVGFLARPRDPDVVPRGEVAPAMRTGMALAALACVLLSLAPTVLVPALGPAVAVVTAGQDPVVAGTVTLALHGAAGSLSPLVLAVALAVASAAVLGGVRLVATHRRRRVARLWDCGGGPLTARMEYTATSFAEPLQRVFDDVLRPEQDVDVTHHVESAYLVRAVEYRRRVPDRIERHLYRPVLAAVTWWGRVGHLLAGGSVHRYLGYGFTSVTALLVLLAVTR
jgi:hydrogenase-4 component B